MKQLFKRITLAGLIKNSVKISLILLAAAIIGICFMLFNEKPMTAVAGEDTATVSGSAITAITVTSPSAGADIEKPSAQTITWTYTAADTVVEAVTGAAIKVELLRSGTAVKMINSSIALATAGTDVAGSISWTPTTDLAAGSGYQIKISSVNYPVVYAVSGEFNIINSYSGQLTKRYTGYIPTYPDFSYDVGLGGSYVPIAMPITLGQTVTGSLSYTEEGLAADYKCKYDTFRCMDLYSIVLDKKTPFIITGTSSNNYSTRVYLYGKDANGYIKERGIIVLRPEGIDMNYSNQFAQNATHCYTLEELGIDSGTVYICVGPFGNYTMTITSPVAGALVSLQDTDSSTLKTAVSGEDGRWDLGYASDGQYQISAGKAGYTFTPEKAEVSASASDINMTAATGAGPEISSFTLDKSEIGFDEIATARIQTSGAADGTLVSVNLLFYKGGILDTGYHPDILSFTGQVSDNEVTIPIKISSTNAFTLYNFNDYNFDFQITIPSGYYRLQAQIEGSAMQMSKSIMIGGGSASQAIHAVADSTYTLENRMDIVRIDVTTDNVADNFQIMANLTDSNGKEFYMPIRSAMDRVIVSNQAELNLVVPATLEAGNYYIQVEIQPPVVFNHPGEEQKTDHPKHLAVWIPYTVYPNDKSITSVKVAGQLGESVIDAQNHTVTVHMPYGSDISALKPTIVFHGEAISQGGSELSLTEGSAAPTVTGYTVDFQNAADHTVTYTITTTDNDAVTVTSSQTWSIKADTQETTFTTFGFSGLTCSTDINLQEHTITVTLPDGTLLSSLAAQFTLSNGAAAKVNDILQESGVTKNSYQKAVIYTVSDASGYTADWTITVKCKTYQFNLSKGTIAWDGGLHAGITVAPSGGPLHSGNETILFTLMQSGQKIGTVTVKEDILKEDTVKAFFNVANTDASYSVLVTVVDPSDVSMELAEPVTLK